MNIIVFPDSTSDEEALTISLTTAMAAREDFEFLDALITTAKRYAAGLDAATVEACKAEALRQAERLVRFEDRQGHCTGAPSREVQLARLRDVFGN